jgi:hypothetical protein
VEESSPSPDEIYSESDSENTRSSAKPDAPAAWLTPPQLRPELDAEFHFDDFDPCPHPRPDGFDGLKVPWPKSTYCNPPFHRKDGIDNQSLTDWVRKAIEEIGQGKTIVTERPTPERCVEAKSRRAPLRALSN